MLVVSGGSFALAESKADGAATELTDRGVAEYNAGHYTEAAALLTRAYELDPAPRLLFNIARAHDRGGEREKARSFYRRYLDGSTEPELAQRARSALARLDAPPDDPPPKPAPTPARPSPTSAPAPALKPEPKPEPAPQANAPSWPPYALMGAGGVVLGAGVGVAIWANATANDMRASTDPVDKPSLRDAASARAVAADITMAVGVVLIASGIVWKLTTRESTGARAMVSPLGMWGQW